MPSRRSWVCPPGVLWEEERYIEGTLKIVVNAGVGNPNASEDDIVNQGG